MKRLIIGFLILILLFTCFFSGCFSEQNESKTTPRISFIAKNSHTNLTEANHEEDIVDITFLPPGYEMSLSDVTDVKNSDIKIMISADDVVYLEYRDYKPYPNFEAPDRWNAGEVVKINEAKVSSEILNADGNWPSTHLYLRIVYNPTKTELFTAHIVLEESS